MKKTMISLVACLILFVAQATQALEYVDEIVLLDGSHIRQCKFEDGSINYCTEEDALNAKRAKKNPELLPENERPKETVTPAKVFHSISTTASAASDAIYSIRGIWYSLGQYW